LNARAPGHADRLPSRGRPRQLRRWLASTGGWPASGPRRSARGDRPA